MLNRQGDEKVLTVFKVGTKDTEHHLVHAKKAGAVVAVLTIDVIAGTHDLLVITQVHLMA